MKITLEILKEYDACPGALEYFEEHCSKIEHDKLIAELMDKKKYIWCNWLISELLTKDNCVKYGIYAVELLLYLFENEYPNDKRPRLAIEAAKQYLAGDIDMLKLKAAARAADAAAFAAAHAADAAAVAADAAVTAVYAAQVADAVAADAAVAAIAAVAAVTATSIKQRIINYGLKLIEEQENDK